MRAITADDVIRILDLRPLPTEGGLFRETYRSAVALPAAFVGATRSLATAIYYLLTPDHVSLMHRVRGDEVFHFYLGNPVEMLQLRADGTGAVVVLGTDLAAGMRPQVVVAGGVWQGAALRAGGAFALLGTTMSPGFDRADFEIGNRAALTSQHPAHAKEIARLTRE